MKKISILIIIGLILLLYLFITSGYADIIYLKSGQKITGRILTKDATGVIIETKLGSMKIKHTQIDRIEQVASEENYLKDGDALAAKGELEKAEAIYQQGYAKTQSPVLKEKIVILESILAERRKAQDEKQQAEQLAQHLAEYNRLKDKLADELALRELEAAKQIDPNNQTVQALLCKEYFVTEEKTGFTDSSSKFAAVVTHLLDLGSTDTTLREYYSRYTAAMQKKAEEKAKLEQLAKEQEQAEQLHRAQLETEQQQTAPILDYDSAFYPEATTWYNIVDSPLYGYGKFPIMTVQGMRVYRADTTAEIPQLIPIRGLLNIPTAGSYAKLRIKKKIGEEITFGTMELKGTMIPILLQLWDNQMLYTTKGAAKLTNMKAQELLNSRTLEVTIQWDTDTSKN
jgi:hypothetical protein